MEFEIKSEVILQFRQQNYQRDMKNSYKILRKIGQGQNGSIFLIQQEKTQQLFAMKKVVYNHYTNINEIKLLPTLNHPNIIKVLQQQQNQTGFTLLQEYATQGDLYTYAQKNFQGKVPQNILLQWLCQIALGLHYLHSEVRVLHRDIKSRNILVMQNGMIKIADFGASRQLLKNQDFAVTAVGTPYYLSPQAVGASKYNSKSDVWGLGCIMFELSTGKKPFLGNSLNDLIKRILNDQIQQIPEQYSEQFRDIVRGMLQKNMDKRISIESILQKPQMKQIFQELRQKYEEDYRQFVYPMITELKTKKYSQRQENHKIGFLSESIKTVKNQQKQRGLKLQILEGWNKQRLSKLPKNIMKIEQKPKKVEHSKYIDRSLKSLIQRKKRNQKKQR